MTRHADVNRSDVVKRGDPGAGGDGRHDRRSRRCATAARSAARSPTTTRRPTIRRAVVALNATVRTNKREIAADQFFTGMFETALQPGEIITAVRFPKVAQAELPEIPQPGLALRDRRRVRREDARPGCGSR